MVEVNSIELFMSFVGLVMALSCTPQILRVLERESSEDVSILTTQMLIFGEVCWIGYSFYVESVSLFVYGFLSLVLLCIQLGVILAYRKPKVLTSEQVGESELAEVEVHSEGESSSMEGTSLV